MQSSIETILGTVKGDNESWYNVFSRYVSQHGIDTRVLMQLVVVLIEEIENERKSRNN